MSGKNRKITGNEAIKKARESGVVNVTPAQNGQMKLTSNQGLPGVFFVKQGTNALDKETAHKLLKIFAYLGVSLLCIFVIIWPLIKNIA